jgi:hypothetical protein
MWTCPDCARRFANRGQVHTCAAPGSLDDRRAAMTSTVRATFDAFASVVRSIGPAEIIVERSRIAFHARMTFAAVVPRRDALTGHLVMAEAVADPRFRRVTSYSIHNHVHEFRLASPGDLDAPMCCWIAAAYQVGMQRHRQT